MQKNYKTFVKEIVLCAIVIYAAIFLIFRRAEPYSYETFFGDIGYTSGLVTLLATTFNRLLWKISFLGKLFKVPNLNGEWEGNAHSNYGEGIDYTIKLKIKQTFLSTIVHANFEKSQSDAFCAVFVHDENSDLTQLVYSYRNDPELEYRNKSEKGVEGGLNIHYGTARLKIDFDDLTHLKGHYWNDRECTGTLTLTKKR